MHAIPSSLELPLIDELSDGAALAVVAADHGLIESVHRHPHGSAFLLRAGYVSSESAAGRWLVPAGYLGWVPPLLAHGAELVGVRGVRIHVRRDLCDELGLPGEPCVVRATPLVVAVIDRLGEGPTKRASLSAREARLLSVLRDEAERAGSSPILLPMPRDARVRRAAEKLLLAMDDHSGLEEAAIEAGMSLRTFTRKFKLDTGLSMGKWRQIARLMRGIQLLATGESVTATAFALGFDSSSSFVALCQRHTGLSPRALARTVAGGDQPG